MSHECIPETVRIIVRNGDSHLYDRCELCEARLTPNLPHGEYDLGRVPVIADYSMQAPPCRVCGKRGVELHHWAPKALFGDEAEVWPQDFLCRACHTRWHQTINGSAA